MWPAFLNPNTVQDDSRTFLFWMARFTDPALFQNDLIANYFEAVSPPGYTAMNWISAVVLVDGRVAGTWTHTVGGKRLRIVVEPFKTLPSAVTSGIRGRADSLANALGLDRAEVKFS